MGLSIQPSFPGPAAQRADPLASAGRPTAADRPAPGAVPVADQADFSPVAVLLAQLRAAPQTRPASLPAPDSAPARALGALLAQRLGALLQRAGLPPGPPLEFDVDAAGRVRVAPDRAGSEALQRLLDDDPDLQALLRLLHAIQTPPPAAPGTERATGPRPAPPDAATAASQRPVPAWWSWPGAASWTGSAGQRAGTGRFGWLAIAALLLAIALWW